MRSNHVSWSESTRTRPLPTRPKTSKPGRIYGRGDPALDMTVIVSGLRGKTVLPNPGGSVGCTPALRELFAQAGASVAVVGETYNDGQLVGHASGDALDLAALNDDSSTSIDQALRIVTSMPTLFSVAAHYRPTTPESSVFVWDGALVSYDDLSTDQIAFLNKCGNHLHVASSRRRLLNAIQTDPTVHSFVLSTNSTAVTLVRDMFTGTTFATGSAVTEDNMKAGSA